MKLSRLMPALLWAATLFIATSGHAQPLSGIDRSAIDARVRPQDDFYTHANGAWLKRAVFPADKAYIGPLDRLNDLTQDQLRALITGARGRTDDPEAKKLGDLYASFMDEAAIERLGMTPLASELARIDAAMAATLTPERLAAIVQLIPDAWLMDEPTFATKTEHRAAYLSYLQQRLAEPRAFVTEAIRAQAQHV